MSDNIRPSQWDVLFKAALKIIDHVNREDELLTSWTFGGGTAMMLQINHRESHDIDLFVDDAQLLPYITRAAVELEFDIGNPDYHGDGIRHLKIAFAGIGEIDFIVAGHMTCPYAKDTQILGRMVELETIAEIIAKKVRFRGSKIQPRDIFDIAAACHMGYRDSIEAALATIPQYKEIAANQLARLKPDYVNTIISELLLKPEFLAMSKNSLAIAHDILQRRAFN